MNVTQADIANIAAVARREFVVRASTRTYLVTTIILVLAAALTGLAPVAIGALNRNATAVAVYVGAADLRADPVATLDALLNPNAESGSGAGASGNAFTVTRSSDLTASRAQVADGALTALLDVERDASGQTAFTVYTNERDTSSVAVISRQAATSIAIADRLAGAGVSQVEQAALFAAPPLTIQSPDQSETQRSAGALAQQEADAAVIFALELFLLLAVVLYGNWIAQSVAEEKSSRMMEIILAAATPFQLLLGKVLGVSAAALLQFAAVIATSVVALIAEGRIAALVLDKSAAVALPAGLTPGVLAAFSIFFVLGFVLYAALFAAAGSLVSRQEDVTQVVQPMTLIVCGGYLVAIYASIGLLDSHAPWVIALSWVPFLSPYTMVSRLASGEAGPLDAAIAVALLAITIVAAAWVASRIYTAGVLMYGQKPSLRGLWKVLHEER
jgi:ABC-2 type transport system permease protein